MRYTRRAFALLAVLLLLGTSLSTALARQDAANPFADLGLPEIAVTVTDTAIEGAPADLPAGRYVLAVTSEATSDDPAAPISGVGFLQPPGWHECRRLRGLHRGNGRGGADGRWHGREPRRLAHG
jgi:hypothetical protein